MTDTAEKRLALQRGEAVRQRKSEASPPVRFSGVGTVVGFEDIGRDNDLYAVVELASGETIKVLPELLELDDGSGAGVPTIENGRHHTTVDETVRLFVEALRKVAPVATKAGIPWREPEAYDDWDEISEALFRAFVQSAVTYAEEGDSAFPLPTYDMRYASYRELSVIRESSHASSALVGFRTRRTPFDTACLALLDAKSEEVLDHVELPVADCRFLLGKRTAVGLVEVDRLTIRF